MEAKLEEMAERDLEFLQELDLVSCNNTKFKSTEYGAAMARYYISLETMQTILNLPEHAKPREIVSILQSNSGENMIYQQIY